VAEKNAKREIQAKRNRYKYKWQRRIPSKGYKYRKAPGGCIKTSMLAKTQWEKGKHWRKATTGRRAGE
jgi:hypothetical protein